MARTRITGFTRFLLFLLVFLPAVWFGVNYYQGEDPVANFRELVGLNTDETRARTQEPGNFRADADKIARLQRELAVAREELARCRTEGVE